MRLAADGAFWVLPGILLPSQRAAPAVSAGKVPTIRPIKTFIVEDSPIIRSSLIATLEELAPVEVIGWVADEAAALRWLGDPDNRPDLVIVDLFLAGGSGLGVLNAARNLPRRTRLVVLSNYATPDTRRRCLALGAERVFDKSGDIDDLLAYCDELAAGKGAPAAAAAL